MGLNLPFMTLLTTLSKMYYLTQAHTQVHTYTHTSHYLFIVTKHKDEEQEQQRRRWEALFRRYVESDIMGAPQA